MFITQTDTGARKEKTREGGREEGRERERERESERKREKRERETTTGEGREGHIVRENEGDNGVVQSPTCRERGRSVCCRRALPSGRRRAGSVGRVSSRPSPSSCRPARPTARPR